MKSSTSSLILNESSTAVIIVNFERSLNFDTSLYWSIEGGEGDFTATSGEVSVQQGASSATFNVIPIDDGEPELVKNFTLVIRGDGNRFANQIEISITLIDDDTEISPFLVTGVTGGADVAVDDLLTDGTIATINWQDTDQETGYQVTIFENNGTTIKCPQQNVAADTTSYTFSTCPLTVGKQYRVRVVAVNGASSLIADNSDFAIFLPPTINVGDASVSEDVASGVGVIQASLSAVSDRDISFTFSTADGTAVSSGAFKDFDSVTNQTVTILAGSLTADLEISIDDDPRDEPDQSLDVSIGNPVNVLIGTGTAALTIIDDDDPPVLTVSPQIKKITEGEDILFDVVLSEVSEKSINFDWSTSSADATAGSDFIAVVNQTELLTPGTGSMTLTVSTIDDGTLCESDEDLSLALSNPVNVTFGAVTPATIVDNDRPVLTFSNPSGTEGSILSFNGNLSFACPQDVQVEVYTVENSAESPADFLAYSNISTITAGVTTLDVDITTVDDTHGEFNEETFLLGFHSPNLANSEDSFGIGTILDNDPHNDITVQVLARTFNQTCAVTGNGRIKCWGDIYRLGYSGGHFGDEPGEMGINLPYLEFGPGAITMSQLVFNGLHHGPAWGVGIRSDGVVYEWGSQNPISNPEVIDLGTHDGDGVNFHTAQKLGTNDHWWGASRCAIVDDGRLKCWGQGIFGGLLSGSTSYRQASDNVYLDFGTDAFGDPYTVKDVEGGFTHLCAILHDDRLKCWGGGHSGALGAGHTNDLGDDPDELGNNLPFVDLDIGVFVQKVFTFNQFTCAILKDGTLPYGDLKCWGNNNRGRLGLGDTEHRGDDPNEMGDNLPVVDLGTHDMLGVTPHKVRSLAYDSKDGVCAILDDYRVKCWGNSDSTNENYGDEPGEMGDNLAYVDLGPGRTARDITAYGGAFCTLLDNDDTVCWGQNDMGQLGRGFASSYEEPSSGLVPIDFGPGLFAVSLHGKNLCAQLNDGEYKCWGRVNDAHGFGLRHLYGGIGDEPGEMGVNLADIELPTGESSRGVADGESHDARSREACTLLGSSKVSCFAGNAVGEMGDSLTVFDFSPQTILKVDGSGNANCVLLDNFSIKCWGRGDSLGTGSGNISDPVTGPETILGLGRRALDMSMGNNHICVLLDDRKLKCWGSNNDGQLGLGDSLGRGADLSSLGDNLEEVDLGSVSRPLKVIASHRKTCVKFENHQLKCWGNNNSGSLGAGASGHIGNQPGEMGDNLNFIHLGSGRSATSFSVGYRNMCVIRDDDSLVCWGENDDGRVGYPAPQNLGDSPSHMGDNLVSVDLGAVTPVSVSTDNHTCVLANDNETYCFGPNTLGSLGYEDREVRGDEASDMGINLLPVDLSW